MLHKETISPHTLELLISIQQKEYLNGFNLVGGTALALHFGHRLSVDLDFFSDFSFDTAYLLENLSSDFDFKLYFSANNTLKGSIEGVKIDICPAVARPEHGDVRPGVNLTLSECLHVVNVRYCNLWLGRHHLRRERNKSGAS